MPTITNRSDATTFVTTCIEGSGVVETANDEYFVNEIVDALYAEAKSWDVESVDTETFWAIVQQFNRETVADQAAAHLDAFVGDGTHVAQWQGRCLEVTAPDGSTFAAAYDPIDDSPGYTWSTYTARDSLGYRDEIGSGSVDGVAPTRLHPLVADFLARHSDTKADAQ